MSCLKYWPQWCFEKSTLYSVLEKLLMFAALFLSLLCSLIQPLTRILAGTTIGTTAALVPLVIGVIPFFARQIENALLKWILALLKRQKPWGRVLRDYF